MFSTAKKAGAVVLASLILLSLLAFTGCSLDPVTLVKTGHPLDYPDKTFEEAYEGFFGNPKWTSFVTSSGETVVEFKGEGTYYGEPGTFTVQFTIDKGGDTFTTTYFAFEDTLITVDEFTEFMDEVFG